MIESKPINTAKIYNALTKEFEDMISLHAYETAQARVKRLEEALEFYADEDTYVDRTPYDSSDDRLVIQDWGEKARAALKEDGE